MVYIKRLELRGFKSFGPQKTVITLDKGFTAVTGPNGSGKSNIMDAIRFVLGEFSIRSLRASKASEVIFDGAPNIEKSKSARVSMQLDNADRHVPVETDTVTISREVRRSGQSIYRMNGKRIQRSKLVSMLSLAGISSAGHNMVLQGTVTKLADITPQDRRRIIEELVGIAQYNANKAKAQEQLQEADINLKIASAKIDEVQNRLESLEKERNDALRYAFIQKEIETLQVATLSKKFSELNSEFLGLKSGLDGKIVEVEKIKETLAQLQLKRKTVESQRRIFDEKIADRDRAAFIGIQKKIGDLNAQTAASNAEMEAMATNLSRLTNIRKEYLQHLETLESSVQKSNVDLERLRRECTEVELSLRGKEDAHKNVVLKLDEIKQSLSSRASKIKEVDNELEGLRKKATAINNQLINSSYKLKILTEIVGVFEERRKVFDGALKEFVNALNDLKGLKQEEQEKLSSLLHVLNSNSMRRDYAEKGLDRAEIVIHEARALLIEYVAKKDFAEKIHTNDGVLSKVEEVSRMGIIEGLFGRFRDLIKVDLKYEKAIYAASAGWFDALVVRDLETALRCIDFLEKTKIGRIKIIPVKWVSGVKALEVPDIDGVVGLASRFVKCDDRYAPAVDFVFGTTLIADDGKAALSASKAGYRAVDLSGKLYEPHGGIEGGSNVQSVVFSALPSEDAIERLSKSVSALELELDQRKSAIKAFEDNANRFKVEAAQRSCCVDKIDGEINIINQNVSCISNNVKILSENIKKFLADIEREKGLESALKTKKSLVEKSLSQLTSQKKSLGLGRFSSSIRRYEGEEAELNEEIISLKNKLAETRNAALLIESNLSKVLKPEFDKTGIRIKNLEIQISALKEKTAKLRSVLSSSSEGLLKLERSRDAVAKNLASIKYKRRKFEVRLDKLDARLKKVNSIYESKLDDLQKIRLEMQRRDTELGHLRKELSQLGYDRPVSFKESELRDVENRLSKARSELEKMGFINQLAVEGYDIQKNNYKSLSIRRNQLEREKRSILQFIEDIEREKREVFMNSYNQINLHFKSFFSKLTGGGAGSLEIQKTEDPFSGGVDIFIQFPGRLPRLVSGASGGERSVAATSFIFAIQSLFPAPFYIFDEIDMHLDPYNAEKLADLIAKQAEKSQFLVMTLKDVIIKRATRVSGVYNQGGVSKIVSIKI